MRTISDPDIGRCDDCGSDEGRRTRSFRVVNLQGEQVRIVVWLCDECRHQGADDDYPSKAAWRDDYDGDGERDRKLDR